MTTPIVAEETTEYVTQHSFDSFAASINEQLKNLEEAFTKSVAQVKQDSLTTMERVVDERLANEREQRQSDINSLKDDLRGQLTELDNKLDEKLGRMGSDVARITGLMESIDNILKTRDEKDNEAHKRIEARIDAQHEQVGHQGEAIAEIRTDIDLLNSNQAHLTNETSRLQTTIHGNPENKDDAPSLFGLLGELQNQVSLGFTTVNIQIEAAMGGISDNQREIATIKQERQAEKEQWQKRRADAIALAKWFFTTRIGILITLLLLGSVAMVIFPELRPVFIENLSQRIDNLPEGIP
ncbi:MAG: hypothetical protein Q9P44_18620 [Anaerolineae bacterium]|nr:hypothetical protein [Anaerolineae bacterium]